MSLMRKTRARVVALLMAVIVAPVTVVALAAPASAVNETALRVFTANIDGREYAPELRDKITNHNPHVLVIEEATRACWSLRNIAKDHGYRVVQARINGECAKRSSTAILVKNNINLDNSWFMKMSESWTGPHGGYQPPRWYPVVRITKGGHTWRVIGIHFPWVGFKSENPCWFREGQNLVAWKESWARVKGSIDSQNIRTVAAGDWNAKPCQLDWRVDGMRGDVDLVATTTKVDHAIVKNSNRQSFRRFSPPYGHGWVKYKIWSPIG